MFFNNLVAAPVGSEPSVRWLESSSVQSSSTSSSEFSLAAKTQSVRPGKQQKNFYGGRTWEDMKCCTFTPKVTQSQTQLGHVHLLDPLTSRFFRKSAVSFIRVPVIHFLLKLCIMSLLRFRRLMQPLPLSLSLCSPAQKVFQCTPVMWQKTMTTGGGGGSGGFSQKPVCRTKPVSSFIAMWTAWCCESWPVKVTWGWTWPGSSWPGWSAAPATGGTASSQPTAPVKQGRRFIDLCVDYSCVCWYITRVCRYHVHGCFRTDK